MFPDSKIAKFQVGPNTCFKGLLIKQLNQSHWLVVSFDESLNKKPQTYQMDLLIGYSNEEKMQLEVRYWDTSFTVRNSWCIQSGS